MIRRAIPTLLRIALIVLALAVGFWAGNRAYGRDHPPVHSHEALVFEPFVLPSTPVPGLHEYAVPLRPAPTASPSPVPSVARQRDPAAGHTGAGSGHRTISRSVHGELGGYATWFATGRSGLYAAAGPALRKAIGPGWRGSHVLVARYGTRKGIEVVLNDWCACGPRNGMSTLLDLSDEAFRALAPLSRGVIRVAVDVP